MINGLYSRAGIRTHDLLDMFSTIGLFCLVYRSQVFGFSNMHVSFWLSNMLRLNVKKPLEFSGKIEWYSEWTRPKNTHRALSPMWVLHFMLFHVWLTFHTSTLSQSQHFFWSVKTQKQKKWIYSSNKSVVTLFIVLCLLFALPKDKSAL
jgi:hypothetical protein